MRCCGRAPGRLRSVLLSARRVGVRRPGAGPRAAGCGLDADHRLGLARRPGTADGRGHLLRRARRPCARLHAVRRARGSPLGRPALPALVRGPAREPGPGLRRRRRPPVPAARRCLGGDPRRGRRPGGGRAPPEPPDAAARGRAPGGPARSCRHAAPRDRAAHAADDRRRRAGELGVRRPVGGAAARLGGGIGTRALAGDGGGRGGDAARAAARHGVRISGRRRPRPLRPAGVERRRAARVLAPSWLVEDPHGWDESGVAGSVPLFGRPTPPPSPPAARCSSTWAGTRR